MSSLIRSDRTSAIGKNRHSHIGLQNRPQATSANRPKTAVGDIWTKLSANAPKRTVAYATLLPENKIAGICMLNRSFSMRPYLFVVLLLSAQTASAHHGVDFLTVQTAHLPMSSTGYAIARVDHISAEEDETEFEPALLFGLTDWMTGEFHAHFARHSGESFEYESIAPSLSFRLTPRQRNYSAGFSVEYELQRHSDEPDVLGFALMSAYSKSSWMLAAQAKMERPSGGDPEWGYAAGIRRSLRQNLAVGIEHNGSFESSNVREWLLGIYAELTGKATINAGIGTGPGDGSDWSVRTALIWQFR